MKVLVTGAAGQLGRDLVARWTPRLEVIACAREQLDITNKWQCREVIARHRPAVVVHAAAFTEVDRCESEPAHALRVNAEGAAHVAEACAGTGARCLAISTDYVFSGDSSRPYHEGDSADPRTVYGKSKLEGELAVRQLCPNHVIVRTAWLYGPGGPSFVHTMARLARCEGPPVRVVHDQRGNPTSTAVLSDILEELLSSRVTGTLHATCAGAATRFDFARAIFASLGSERTVEPCTTADFPRPAKRPANSCLVSDVMAREGMTRSPMWQAALAEFLRSEPL